MKRSLIALLFSTVMIGMEPAYAAVATLEADDLYSRAETPSQITTERLEDGRYRTRLPLAAIRAAQGGLRLDGADAGEALSVALAPQAKVDSMRLVLRHASSRAMQDMHSHLKVSVNGQFAAQLDAATGASAVMDEITIDPIMLKSGFNQISLDAVQRYTLDCQDPTASELWTEIDTLRSHVELVYERAPFSGRLGDLDAFMTPGVGGVDTLTIVTGENVTRDHLKWGAIGAQAVANRLDYRMPEISHAKARISASPLGAQGPAGRLEIDAADSDILLIGTFENIGDVLTIDPSAVPQGEGYLAAGPSPVDPSHFIIVASGHDAEAVERALNALAMQDFPFADTSDTQITAQDAPTGLTMAARAPQATGVTYTFADLGAPTRTFVGEETANVDIPLELPADFFPREEEMVTLALDFAYGAALEPDSVLNVLVNGVFRQALPLNNPHGEAAAGYKLQLPARIFDPGRNVISLTAELSARQAGACATRNMRNMVFVMEGSSRIRLPDSPRYVQLPDLNLMANTGYPYSGATHNAFAVRAATRSSENMAAVWTVAARLAQPHKAVFNQVDFDFGAVPAKADTLMIGARSAMHDLMNGPMQIHRHDGKATPQSHSANAAQMSRMIQFADLGRNGLMLADENPQAPETLLTVVTAQSDAALLSATRHLVQPSHWTQMQGAAAVWRENPATFATSLPRSTFHRGSLSASDRVAYENASRPWRWILLTGALLFAIAAILAGVARYMRQRAQG